MFSELACLTKQLQSQKSLAKSIYEHLILRMWREKNRCITGKHLINISEKEFSHTAVCVLLAVSHSESFHTSLPSSPPPPNKTMECVTQRSHMRDFFSMIIQMGWSCFFSWFMTSVLFFYDSFYFNVGKQSFPPFILHKKEYIPNQNHFKA